MYLPRSLTEIDEIVRGSSKVRWTDPRMSSPPTYRGYFGLNTMWLEDRTRSEQESQLGDVVEEEEGPIVYVSACVRRGSLSDMSEKALEA